MFPAFFFGHEIESPIAPAAGENAKRHKFRRDPQTPYAKFSYSGVHTSGNKD